jgi:methyl-accepting chemotaxis protein
MSLYNLNVKSKLFVIAMISTIGFIFFFILSIAELKSSLFQERESRLKSILELVISRADALSKTESEERAKEMVRSLIKSIRYDNDNYVFIFDNKLNVIEHPLKPELNGSKITDVQGDSEHWIRMQSMSQSIGEGSIEYTWVSPNGIKENKLSYIMTYRPWGWIIGTGLMVKDIENEIESQIFIMAIGCAIIIVFVLLIAYYISNSIVTRLHLINIQMKKISIGDLRVSFDTTGRDEISELSQSVEKGINAVIHAISAINIEAGHLMALSEDISVAARQTDIEVNNQKEKIEQVVIAMDQMSATISEIAYNSENSARNALEAKNEAGLGNKDVSSSVIGIQNLADEVNSVSDKIKQLEEGVSKISSVTTIISSISDQTNLLALNAAIEAARAGDHGRGFAVVADEVRQLAKRTRQSTEEIQNTVSDLQERARTVVNAIDKSSQLAIDSVKQAETAGKDLSLIVGNIQQVSDNAMQIATSAEEQNVVSEDINKNIHDIFNSGNEVAQVAKSLAEKSSSLNNMSTKLTVLLSYFKT